MTKYRELEPNEVVQADDHVLIGSNVRWEVVASRWVDDLAGDHPELTFRRPTNVIVDRDGSVVTQGAFNLMMEQYENMMDKLEKQKNNTKLKIILADLIRYSFEHMRMYENGTSTTASLRALAIDMLAYQIACFIANNTREGDEGVDSQQLVERLHMLYGNCPDLTIEGWIDWLVNEYGGEIIF